jgi:hypothetical protein
LAATDGFGAGGRVCRRSPGRSGDRRAGRLAAPPRDADAPATCTCMSLRKFPSACSLGRRRMSSVLVHLRPVMLRGSPRLAKNAPADRARVAPTTSTASQPIDHPTTSLGPRCAIATSATTIRSPSTIRPSRTSLGPRGDPFQILYQKNYALCGNRLNWNLT